MPPSPERVRAGIRDLDARIDVWFDRIRSPRLDAVFFGLSSAADHGLLWGAVAGTRGTRRGDPASALRFGAALTVESALTNGPVKALFRRGRPASTAESDTGALPYGMHRPLTSSFPSGHAVSAFTAAALLAEDGGASLWYALAGVVAVSRVYTRMHHASDVVAGAALGVAFGALARRVVGRRSRPLRRR